MSGGDVWALILAGGEGTRLSSLTTTPAGLTVPKQFCSLHGGVSLLEETLSRAAVVAPRSRMLAVVAGRHRRWWEAPLCLLPPLNIIVQPENKGTAVGLLLPLLHLAQRNPTATVVVLPSDHFVRDEAVLAQSLQHVARLAHADHQHIYLLGLEPERTDPELGYIVPEERTRLGVARVRRFVEKPPFAMARGLVDSGALWNVFIVAASVRALLSLHSKRYAGLIARMTDAVEQDRLRTHDSLAAERLYTKIPTVDFSRDVLEGQESMLRVVTVPACGWSDLGTPQRVADALSRCRGGRESAPTASHAAYLSLADQHSRQQLSNCAPAHS
jgi:mannose-1-phosphate guanylyltransferase